MYDLESGAKKISMASETLAIKGSTLLALAGRRRYQVEEAREAKQLMRRVIQRHLGDRKIESRELFRGSSHRLDV